ncbi:MAG: TIM barrel protein [Verrucomicrobiae bacterium]|nr:TIM barrel protein [Verrucomicrobiae bacterium]MDW8310800.1 TIM barrel protein [Verrucomicrobiales bacterium]
MAAKHSYKFCFGPWNLSEGQDPYGPPTRPAQTFEWKLAQLKKLGFDAMMFHDDDAVPDVDNKSPAEIRKATRELKKKLADAGVAAEMVAPRLWFDPRTVDGAFTSNDPACRRYAIERSLRCIDIAKELGTDLIVLWLAREGSYLRESKNARRCVDYLVEALDKMLAYDKKVRIAIEPKPNEPMDQAYIPTIGHALALAQLTRDPARVGCLIETAHAILAGLDPADEIDFACAFGKLWSLHLNDQNGLKFDQDKPFGSANLRMAFNQVRALERNGYGKRGEYVCFDVHPFRPTKVEHWLAHLDNSRRTFLRLVEKARTFPEKEAQKLIADRNYAALDQLVLEHLMGR